MTPHISARAQLFTESVIREMTRLCLLHGAVNLAQGFPDFPAPADLKEAGVEAIRKDLNQYAITWGAKTLRDALVEKIRLFQGLEIDPEQMITVCCGATEAMIASLLALVNPGDEVVVFEPFYENYGPDAILSGAVPRFVKLREPDWSFDSAELAAAFTERTRAIIINNPNNPTGKVFSRAELEEIAALCQQWNVVAVTDEIYEHILFDGETHTSLATLEGMFERTVTISGLSKTYSVTGWRLGYAIAPPRLTNAIRKVHDFLTVGAPHPLQEAAATALRFPAVYYTNLAREYTGRRDYLLTRLAEAGFRCFVPKGAYYIMTDITQLTARSDVEFVRYLITEIGVAAVPGSSFYSRPADGATKVRFCFAKKESTLQAAGERLARLTTPVVKG